MALRKSTQVGNRASAISCSGADDLVPIIAEFIVPAGLTNGDIIEMLALPAGMIPESIKIAADDCDTANTATFDCGLMTGQYFAPLDDAGAARACGNEFFAAATTLQAGGVLPSTVKAGHMIAPSFVDRSVGIKLTGVITPVVGAKIRLFLMAAPAPVGMVFV